MPGKAFLSHDTRTHAMAGRLADDGSVVNGFRALAGEACAIRSAGAGARALLGVVASVQGLRALCRAADTQRSGLCFDLVLAGSLLEDEGLPLAGDGPLGAKAIMQSRDWAQAQADDTKAPLAALVGACLRGSRALDEARVLQALDWLAACLTTPGWQAEGTRHRDDMLVAGAVVAAACMPMRARVGGRLDALLGRLQPMDGISLLLTALDTGRWLGDGKDGGVRIGDGPEVVAAMRQMSPECLARVVGGLGSICGKSGHGSRRSLLLTDDRDVARSFESRGLVALAQFLAGLTQVSNDWPKAAWLRHGGALEAAATGLCRKMLPATDPDVGGFCVAQYRAVVENAGGLSALANARSRQLRLDGTGGARPEGMRSRRLA